MFLPSLRTLRQTDNDSIDTGRYECPDDIAPKNSVLQRVGLIEWGQAPSDNTNTSENTSEPSRRMPPLPMLMNTIFRIFVKVMEEEW